MFQSLFEANPHDLVHGYVGGDMGSVLTSALDPVFYAHHANIDRYWAKWLQQGGGRTNPTGSWAGTTFNFQTVSGPKAPTAGAAQTPEALGYTYDSQVRVDVKKVPDLLKYLNGLKDRYKYPRTLPIPPRPPGPGPWVTVAATNALELDGNPTVVRVPNKNVTTKGFVPALKAPDTDIVLTLYDVRSTRIAQQGGYVYQVFLTSSEKDLAQGLAKTAVEVASFSSFSVSVAEQHQEHAQPSVPQIRLPISAEARKLLVISGDSDPALVFVRRGLITKGREIEDNVEQVFFTIGEIRIEAKQRTSR